MMNMFKISLAAALLGVVTLVSAAAAPEAGQPAPEFRLQDQNGNWHTLADHRGHWVVLYFYPKDDTPGCTAEACTFRDHVFKLKRAGADVLGVSLDDIKSHEAFAKKYQLPFPLLADTTHAASEAYGVLQSTGPFVHASRETFLINPEGRVAKHYEGVDPKVNAPEVLAELEKLKAAAAGKPAP